MNLTPFQQDHPAEPSIETFEPGILARKIEEIAVRSVADNKAIQRSLPDVAAHVIELCQLAYTDAARVEKAVSRDPFISGQLVSVANSAMFARASLSSVCAMPWFAWASTMCATS